MKIYQAKQAVQNKVPTEIVNVHTQKVLRDLNLMILSVGSLMEESAYLNYEDPSWIAKELFPRSGIRKEYKQHWGAYIQRRDDAEESFNNFIEHPVIREILQSRELTQVNQDWTKVLPIVKQYLKITRHVISLNNARCMFESRLPKYIWSRNK